MAVIVSFSIVMSCQQPADNISDNISSKLPPPHVVNPQFPPEPYHGLNTTVSELVSTYESGGDSAAETYAKKRGIYLIDGMVKVNIEIKLGCNEAAAGAVNSVGAKITYVYGNGNIIALVPLNQIKSLAGNPALKLISVPGGLFAN